jgi:Amt family ammonium transporter
MQTGFVLIEFGAVRRKNSQSMLIKNLLNTVIAILAFWLIGYGFGFGSVSQYIGNDSTYFASYNFEGVQVDNYPLWFIQLAYAIVVGTIW